MNHWRENNFDFSKLAILNVMWLLFATDCKQYKIYLECAGLLTNRRRQTDRQTDTLTERDTHTDRHRHTPPPQPKHTPTHTPLTHTHTHTYTHTHTHTDKTHVQR
jgi:hypothetical protein